jgi:hypothetical protein
MEPVSYGEYSGHKIFAQNITGGSAKNPQGSFNCPSLKLHGYNTLQKLKNAIDKKAKPVSESLLVEMYEGDCTVLRPWSEIQKSYAEQGKHHCLHLVCEFCDNQLMCRCSTPKDKLVGVCPECMKRAESDSNLMTCIIGMAGERK